MMHPGVRKQALDMRRRFKIDQLSLYNAIKKVRKGCLVCQACNPDNRNVKGEAQWTPVPDQPMESVAMDVFSMPEVHIGKETFDCVVLCVYRHSGYVVTHYRGGPGHGTLRWTRTSKQAGKVLRSQGHHHARVM